MNNDKVLKALENQLLAIKSRLKDQAEQVEMKMARLVRNLDEAMHDPERSGGIGIHGELIDVNELEFTVGQLFQAVENYRLVQRARQ